MAVTVLSTACLAPGCNGVASTGARDDGFSDPSRWSSVDLRPIFGSSVVFGYAGAAFDGRYVYFAPGAPMSSYGGEVTPTVVRYDTTEPFAASTSWSAFDTTIIDPNSWGAAYAGAVFDGRYVYFLPGVSCDITCGGDGAVVRVDTHGNFTSASAWSVFDTKPLTKSYDFAGFFGGVFDGRYVYLVPAMDGVALRYDTDAAFSDAASWEVHMDAEHYDYNAAGVFDGRYVYFSSSDAVQSGVTRYDTLGSFASDSSWSHSTSQLAISWSAFDGQFVYFGAGAHLERRGIDSDFTSAASWERHYGPSLVEGPPALGGAAWDGRYLYVADPAIARYDTQADFAKSESWSTFVLTAVSSNAPNAFEGAVFDGRYVYLVPAAYPDEHPSVVLRFDAKSPPSMPALPGWNGSFF